ncbi:unnamed protein product [Rotaria sp. Silwood1]|nr:unnamed protein product [Rotaria sp. Silwood1]CAF3694832.1 unnamed protein product [Rotaria sp. Silwood1]CAF4973014.1 unnamed protein product [Rotaria sp. Silwood1]
MVVTRSGLDLSKRSYYQVMPDQKEEEKLAHSSMSNSKINITDLYNVNVSCQSTKSDLSTATIGSSSLISTDGKETNIIALPELDRHTSNTMTVPPQTLSTYHLMNNNEDKELARIPYYNGKTNTYAWLTAIKSVFIDLKYDESTWANKAKYYLLDHAAQFIYVNDDQMSNWKYFQRLMIDQYSTVTTTQESMNSPVNTIVDSCMKPQSYTIYSSDMLAMKAHHALMLEDLKTLPRFTGEESQSINSWLEEIELVYDKALITDNDKCYRTLKLLPNIDDKWLEFIRRQKLDWNELKRKLISRFEGKKDPSRIELEDAIRNRCYHDNEPMHQYYSDIMRKCDLLEEEYPVSDRHRIDYIIRGLPDSIQDQLLIREYSTPKELLEETRSDGRVLQSNELKPPQHLQSSLKLKFNKCSMYNQMKQDCHLKLTDLKNFSPTTSTKTLSSSCINLLVNNHLMKTMIDSGSDDSFISPEALDKISPQPIIHPTNKDFQAMNGTQVIVSGYVILTIDFDKNLSDEIIYVSPQTNIDLLLGQTWIKKHQAILNCKDQCITIMTGNGPKSIRYIPAYEDNSGDTCQQYNIRLVHDVTIKPRMVQPVDAIYTDCVLPKNAKLGKVRQVPLTNFCCNITESFESFKPDDVIPHKILEDINILIKHLKPEHQQLIRPILLREWKVFDISKPSQATDLKTKHRIITQDHPSIYQRPYRVPESIKQQQKELTDEMERNGQISRSQSPWESPVLLVKKHDGSPRFVVDYRKLNSITIRDSYPLPRMDDTINKLAGARYYSKFDLKCGYHQIPIDPRDKQKTTFIPSYGLFEFNVLPQGLINGPPVFQRIMNEVLGDLLGHHCLVYLDDIITFSRNINDHIKDIHAVLHALNNHNFKLNLPKCALIHERIEYLGHEIDHSGYRPLRNNIKAVIDIPRPTTYDEAHRFYGMANYYRSFIKNFAAVAYPLQRFQATKGEFVWKAEQQLAFDTLKKHLVSEPCTLNFPMPNVPFILATDASSKNGIGVTLKQKIDKKEHVIVYLSQNLNKVERKWSVTEQECWAIVWAIKKLRIYLYGTKFTVITDHHPLCWLNKHTSENEKLYRWSLVLQEYEFDIQHKSGLCHLDADCLSRCISSTDTPDDVNNDEHNEDTIPAHNEFRPSLISQNNAVQTRAQKAALDNASKPKSITSSKPQPTTTSTPQPTTPSPESNNSSSTLGFNYLKIPQQQLLDPFIQQRIHEIKQHPGDYPLFVVEQGILYKLIEIQPGRTKKKVPWVPQSMIKDLLFSAHTHPTSAHYGSDRTYYKLKNNYYWPNMLKDIKLYVKQCLLCARYNIPRQKPPGLLETPEPPSEIFDLIGVDFWGPTHDATSNGNRYIITCTDHLSKFVIAKAVPIASASEAAKFLVEDVIFKYGHIPKHILTDQGSHFNNYLMQAITKDIGINHILSTPFHPQTNGTIERFNATIKAQLCKLQDLNRTDWDQYLSPTIYAYNIGQHRTTKYDPYQLLYGKHPTLPFAQPQPMLQFMRSNDYYNQFRKYRSFIIQQARRNIQQQQQLSKKRYDQHRQHIQYEIGQLVLAKPAVRNNKMQAIFEGPYRATNVLGPVTYEIQLEHSDYVRQVHVNIMKPIFEPQD